MRFIKPLRHEHKDIKKKKRTDPVLKSLQSSLFLSRNLLLLSRLVHSLTLSGYYVQDYRVTVLRNSSHTTPHPLPRPYPRCGEENSRSVSLSVCQTIWDSRFLSIYLLWFKFIGRSVVLSVVVAGFGRNTTERQESTFLKHIYKINVFRVILYFVLMS